MKSERDLFKQDLSKQEGSYTKAIEDNIKEINAAAEDWHINNEAFKALVLKIVETAHDTAALRKFKLTLKAQRTKEQSIFYVYNAHMKGCGLEVV